MRHQEWPEKKSKLTVDIQANPKVHEALAKFEQAQTAIEKVDIQMPEIDLSKKLPEGKDVVSNDACCEPMVVSLTG